MRTRLRATPGLGLLVGTAAAITCLLVVVVTCGVLALLGVMTSVALIDATLLGAAFTVLGGVAAGAAAEGFAARLRGLSLAAVQRMEDPHSRALERWDAGALACAELLDLSRTLEALALRAKVADDVADRHRRTAETASAGMFELLSGLVAAEEGARGQLSAELHDTVAQSLALARQHLADADVTDLDRAREYVEDAEEQVRAVMARTRPPALREGDLASAVRGLKDELEQRYGVVVHVSWPVIAHPLPLVTAITIYRFFQEALLNVVKHADVDWAEASLLVDDHGVVATVSDAGPGFDPDEVRPAKGRHVGLGLLRERARLAGGSLEISSMPAAGTVLQLSLPRPQHATRAVPEQAAAPVPAAPVSARAS